MRTAPWCFFFAVCVSITRGAALRLAAARCAGGPGRTCFSFRTLEPDKMIPTRAVAAPGVGSAGSARRPR